MPTPHSRELHAAAERFVAALPPIVEEAVLTGSVSRGVADELSDIEVLLVTTRKLDLDDCFEHARRAGLVELDTWGLRSADVARVFGYFEGIPIESTWWSREHAEASVAAAFAGEPSTTADALTNGIGLRTGGRLAAWQERLGTYPDALAAARVEDAAVAWGGFHPTGFLTLARPGERLALVEYLHADALRVLRIVYAMNRVWQPTSKRLADRVRPLPVKPDRLAERIEEALTEPDPLRAMLALGELQVETADLAPAGPNVVRARRWLREVVDVLRAAIDSRPA